ncbi:MAG: winged helix-turn-helix domain-containing protein [Nanoarchaeota archaeon]
MTEKESKKITIIKYPYPDSNSLNAELQWLGNSLGLFNLRDKDKSMFRIFITLLKSGKQNLPISSDEIADELALSRGTVIHHINKMINSGIVVTNNNRYILRVDNIKDLIDAIENDILDILYELKAVASDIDKKMDL